MSRFHVVVSREDGSFPADIRDRRLNSWRPAVGSIVVGESDAGVDALAFVGDDVAGSVRDAVAFAVFWGDVHGERLVMSVLVQVPNAYERFSAGGTVEELAHVGMIDIGRDAYGHEVGHVVLGATDLRVWNELQQSRVRFV